MNSSAVTIILPVREPAADWLQTLRRECDATSQVQVARLLDLSAATVSQVLHGKYAADTARIERRVRGVLMGATVQCPVMFEIGTHVCQRVQECGKPPAPHFEHRAWYACRGLGQWARAGACKHYTPAPARKPGATLSKEPQ